MLWISLRVSFIVIRSLCLRRLIGNKKTLGNNNENQDWVCQREKNNYWLLNFILYYLNYYFYWWDKLVGNGLQIYNKNVRESVFKALFQKYLDTNLLNLKLLSDASNCFATLWKISDFDFQFHYMYLQFVTFLYRKSATSFNKPSKHWHVSHKFILKHQFNFPLHKISIETIPPILVV